MTGGVMTGRSPSYQPNLRHSAPAADGEARIRGLLHDLGHQMMTLSLLAESVRDDRAMSAKSRRRMELVVQEMLRATDMINDSIAAENCRMGDPVASVVDVRDLAAEVAQLAGLAHETTITVRPDRSTRINIRISPTLLWRVLANLVDNSVRAAGPRGTVEISVEQDIDTVIEIADDGPGFGAGQRGMAGLGMSVVEQLLELAGGKLEVGGDPGGGTRVRVIFKPEPEYKLTPASAGTWH